MVTAVSGYPPVASSGYYILDNYRNSRATHQIQMCLNGNTKVPIEAHGYGSRALEVSYALPERAAARQGLASVRNVRCPRVKRSDACSASIEPTVTSIRTSLRIVSAIRAQAGTLSYPKSKQPRIASS